MYNTITLRDIFISHVESTCLTGEMHNGKHLGRTQKLSWKQKSEWASKCSLCWSIEVNTKEGWQAKSDKWIRK